jgi:hypothetical protein
VIQSTDGGCKCQPTNLDGVTEQLKIIASAQVKIIEKLNESPKVLPATDIPAAPVGAHRLYLRAVPLN